MLIGTMAGNYVRDAFEFQFDGVKSMKRSSIGMLLVFVAIVPLFRWAYSENHAAEHANDPPAKASSGGAGKIADSAAGTEFRRVHSYQEQHTNTAISSLSLDTLKERAKDIAACLRLQKQERIANTLLAQSSGVLDDYSRDRIDQSLAMSNSQITKLQSEGACAGLDENLLTGVIYPLLLEMAKKGDAEAANCYVAADFDLDEEQRKPDQIEDYRRNAAALVDTQMEKGDWRMVELMEIANDSNGDPHRGRYSWFREISAGKPALAYGYNRLLRLGSTDDYGVQLDSALDARKAELTAAQIAEQDAWAEREYEEHFKRSAPISVRIPTCALYSDTRTFHHVARSVE